MREAVIVSTARTPIGKAYRGAFNDTTTPTMAAPVIKEVVKRAKADPVRSMISLWEPRSRKEPRGTTWHGNVPSLLGYL